MGGGNQVVDGMVPAGPWLRLAAWLIDAVLVAVITGVAFNLLLGSVDAAFPVGNAAAAVVLWLYLSLLQISGARTVGKRLIGIRVVQADGSPVGLGRTLTRNAWVLFAAIPFLSWLALLLAIALFVSIFAAPQLQGVHDRVTDTAVIRR